MAVEVVLRLPDNGLDIESVQDRIMDALYAAGFKRIEPIEVTLVEDDKPCSCG